MMKLGSLFDGIGGFPLGFSRHGFSPVWASEIVSFPIRVTSLRFPGMKHMGDITQINGGEIELVDVIAGGSPCQDLSVAGKRAGLCGARSGLFMEQVRIVREMRHNHGKPRFMVWENVPGALSSNGGEDYRIVLEETCRIADDSVAVPGPPAGGWQSAGAIVGDGYSVAWRVLDAQYWGVPQRRRRIYLVADFSGESAIEVLFKRDGLRRHLEAGGEARQDAAGDAEGGAGAAGFDLKQITCPTNRATVAKGAPMPTINCGGQGAALIWPTISNTLPARMDGSPCVDRGPQMVVAGFRPNQSAIARSLAYSENVSPTLPSEAGGNKACVVYPINEQAAHPNGKCNGAMIGESGEPMYSLTGRDRHAIAHTLRSSTGGIDREDSNTLIIMAHGQANAEITEGVCPTLNCNHEQPIAATGLAVRRLTPLECERLQGFHDGWTDIPGASDSARYKALGNSVAIPCVEFVAEGIVEVLLREAEGI